MLLLNMLLIKALYTVHLSASVQHAPDPPMYHHVYTSV